MTKYKVIFNGLWVALSLCAGLASADTLALKEDHPDRYVVVKGDTLWDISARFLEDPWMWPKIWRANPEIDNPHLIYPGDVIVLRFRNGKPVLEVQRERETVKLSPHTRMSPLDAAIPTIPLDAVKQFLLHPRVLTREEVDNAGYILANQDGHLISGVENVIYARDLPDEQAGSYDIFRVGETYRDPGNNELLGYEAILVGNARVRASGDPTKLEIVDSNREALLGDRLLPVREQRIGRHFMPHPPDDDVQGRIIAVLDGVSRIGQYQTVVVNIGRDQGMESGHVLAVNQEGGTVRDTFGGGGEQVRLPDERAGLLMVVRSFDRVSYALVMQAERDMRLLDRVAAP